MDLVRLDLEFLLAIEVTAHIESLKMRILSWLDVSEIKLLNDGKKFSGEYT